MLSKGMVRPLKMAVLCSVHPLPDQCLADLPTRLPLPQIMIILIKGVVRGVPLYWFPLITNELT